MRYLIALGVVWAILFARTLILAYREGTCPFPRSPRRW